MPKTGGDITRKKILDVAETLFSRQGFDGTSIDQIAKQTGINKATIYYHFTSKNAIMDQLFLKIIRELHENIALSAENINDTNRETMIEAIFRKEIEYLEERKDIISVLFMESLKAGDTHHFLFKCAEITIQNELDLSVKKKKLNRELNTGDKDYFFIYEFFTGFIPFISFVIFKEKWIDYFKCDEEKLTAYFLDAFKKSHFAGH